MRHMVVFLAAILWAMPVQAETKKAPDGFGPIKFGMTKEEAWAAIDGKGEWEDDDTLVYELELVAPPFLDLFEVTQSFTDGLAGGSRADGVTRSSDLESCENSMAWLAALIGSVYGQSPVRGGASSPQIGVLDTSYLFAFRNGSLIHVNLKVIDMLTDKRYACFLHVSYYEPFSDDGIANLIDKVF